VSPEVTEIYILIQSLSLTHTDILRPSWILSRTTRVSWHQKGKTSLDLLQQVIMMAVASAGPYANLHLDPDT